MVARVVRRNEQTKVSDFVIMTKAPLKFSVGVRYVRNGSVFWLTFIDKSNFVPTELLKYTKLQSALYKHR